MVLHSLKMTSVEVGSGCGAFGGDGRPQQLHVPEKGIHDGVECQAWSTV